MATPVTTPFQLEGADGGPLRGDIRTSGNGAGVPAVVVSHGFKGFKDWGFFPEIAARLAGAGITVISFNFSGSGVGPDMETFSEPERFCGNSYSNQTRDVATVIDAVRAGGLTSDLARPTAVGLLGHSMGGAAAIFQTARRNDIDSLVTWAAISRLNRWDAVTLDTWREKGIIEIANARTGEILPLGIGFLRDIEENGRELDPVANAARVTAPWLIVHGDADEAVAPEQAKELQESSTGAELLVIGGGTHTFGACHPWAGMTPELTQVFEATVSHFVDSLL
jgi:pimeloyl-ACP methyl ester carboxylesterase